MRRAGAQTPVFGDFMKPACGLPFEWAELVMGTVDALLFDLGRVVIDIDTARIHARWVELAGVPASHINATSITGSEIFRQHERGEITDAAFFAELRRDLQIDLTDDQFIDGWNTIFVGEMPGIRGLLCRAHGQLPLYGFSNTNPAHQAYWSVHFAELLAPFRKIYVSHEIGARKPERAAFEAVVGDIGVDPRRILFFDDVAENVLGARACGLQAVHVATTADVERALAGIVPAQA
jgi:glucose-1-phosphatase